MVGSIVMGLPNSWMVYNSDNPHLEMDDDWGYPVDVYIAVENHNV